MSKHHARPLWHSIRAVWVDDAGGNVRCPSQIYHPSWFSGNWLLPKDGCFLHHSPGSFSIEPWNDHNLTVLSTETLKSSFWIIVFVMTKSLPFYLDFPLNMAPHHLSLTEFFEWNPGWIARCWCHETLEVAVLYSDVSMFFWGVTLSRNHGSGKSP